jgi:hypothetical protein
LFLKQRAASANDGSNWLSTLTVDIVGVTRAIGYDSDPTDDFGIWNIASRIIPLTTQVLFSATWALWTSLTVHAASYAEIRAFGQDPQDTSPVDWEYTG